MPTPAAQFLSGQRGRASIHSTVVAINRWKVNPKCQSLDFTTSDSGGFGEWLSGIEDCDIEIAFDYYLTQAPFTMWNAGDFVENVFLYLDAINGPSYWNFPLVQIVEHENSLDVRGKVSGIMRAKNSGEFFYPQF